MGDALKDATGDPSSLSNPGSVRGIHLKLELSVEFEKRIIHGTASYMCRVEEEGATHFILDTSTLVISSVQVDGTRAKFMQRVEHPIYGSALEIALPGPPRAVGSTLDVVVVYHTSTRSTAVQWLPPAQTAGKEHPYLFTQCQAIHARSLLPCQVRTGLIHSLINVMLHKAFSILKLHRVTELPCIMRTRTGRALQHTANAAADTLLNISTTSTDCKAITNVARCELMLYRTALQRS
jgi:Peptidase M1 N-terminal domain